jgi:hypothetical protein
MFGIIIPAVRARRRLTITQIPSRWSPQFFHPTVSGALIISGREAAVESNTAGQTGMGVVTVAAQGGDFTAKRITAEFVGSAVAPARFWSSFVTTGVHASKPCWRLRPG